MLHVRQIRDYPKLIIDRLEKRGLINASEIIEEVIKLDDQRRTTKKKLDDQLATANEIAKQIGLLIKNGEKEKAEQIKEKTQTLKQENKELQKRLQEEEETLYQLLYTIPNIPHESVPGGQSEQDNEVILEQGEKPSLHNKALPHWELIKKYNIIDFELGNKITGAGFPVYRGKGARLQRALVNFFLDEALKAGYTEIQPPILVNQDSGIATGQLPDKEGQMYHVQEMDYYLIPTAEVPITNIYRNDILDIDQLPIKNVGYTPCFRKEAGSWGAHVRGLNRLHQFDKVEIVQIQHPEKSYETLEEMSTYVQTLLKKLELPYRVLKLCGGDLGFTSALTYDMEVYSAAQKKWLEVSSVSNFESYQANRLSLRYKGVDKKTHLLHTLNGSALALPRIVAALLENNQKETKITIPDVLIPYTGFKEITLE